MTDTDTNKKIESYCEFLDKWPIKKMEKLNIEDYTNSNKNSFTYDIEFLMKYLGSFKGGSSFKFGIYNRKDSSYKENTRGKIYETDFAWFKKYGCTKDDAFNSVILAINNVIKYSQRNDLQAIDKINLGKTYKWKIAFHYQDKNNISIVPIFTYNALKLFLEKSNMYRAKMSMSDMYCAIKEKNSISTLDKAFNLSDEIWADYIRNK